ncbi:MAG: hypothetical protein ACR2RL_17975 [Gammaproteobacteria bacterium]
MSQGSELGVVPVVNLFLGRLAQADIARPGMSIFDIRYGVATAAAQQRKSA